MVSTTAPASLPPPPTAACKASATNCASGHRPDLSILHLSASKPNKPPFHSLRSTGSSLSHGRLCITKAQLNEKADVAVSEEKDDAKEHSQLAPLSDDAISEFMSQVTSLVKLVDSKDISELQLKQHNCELIIRKKEALPQPASPAPVFMMHQPSAPAAMSSSVSAPPPPSLPPVSQPPAPQPKALKSSHPPIKSPMTGTFYRSPGPGLDAFVKVGDKVKKGQVLCIIEAMKLMNEIESDQEGTVMEILAEDGKPVSIDQPIFAIEP